MADRTVGNPLVPEGAAPPQSRRRLLTAGLGGLAGVVLGSLGFPRRADAAAGQALIIGSEANNAGSANTQLLTNSNVVAFKLLQNGPGTALMGYATPTTGQTRGVYGRTDSAAGFGAQARNAATTTGGGAAVQAIGVNNHGIDASTETDAAHAVMAVNPGTATGGKAALLATLGDATDATIHPGWYRGAGEFVGPNGVVAASTNSIGVGVVADVTGTGGFGVRGRATAATGNTAGVRGDSSSSAGSGVVGMANATTGTNYGVRGLTYSPSGYAVYGSNEATTGGATAGLFETSSEAGWALRATSPYVGIAGMATATSGYAYGVYGSAAANGWAMFAEGNVAVTGTLSKGGGAFKIDHPLEPANKYLLHSFVESPDMKNVYDGVTKLDAGGEATIELPDWFEALNRDFRYQLTPIGASAPDLFIKSGVKDNRFTIAGGSADLDVSWQVTGIRHDAWAEAHRIPVEEKKTGDEKGRYMHPAEHGKPASKGLKLPKPSKPAPAPATPKNQPNQGSAK